MASTLRMFARGRDVIKLQQLLNKSAFISKLAEDGIFGRNTYHAVKIFQRHHGLNDDGIVGPETWRKLSREPFIRNSSVSYSVSSSSLIKRGKLTYDAEGNNIPNSRYYSRVIHWPGNEGSGVTLGRGYDMGDRTESSILQDMLTAGIDADTARKISLARSYKGSAAGAFVTNNKRDIGEITEEQQIRLFNHIYPDYITRTITNYNRWTSDVAAAKHWDELDQPIQEVLIDFVYQGFTKGPRPMLAGSNNDKQELINYIRNTPGISRYEPGRHRADYLERN
ncbi:peptidoglycan-binding protein [Salmonella enterica]|uniref:EF hand domain-containing protein n=1 Tax=Salmonella enterica subsp. indica serovar 6,14,25:z10:1,(2),7 str. 1121 TaxID=1173950 RepID=V1GTZ4_SALER|nr:peptidoglycan-binding protein [Salmonella enterica]EBP3213771.1 calcium sensor EFh [Salmonella enterica subsp. arizonae]EEJ9033742.1 calcium sensor EFh [Salmonella enterica subsp. enterica serovar Oslo]EHN2305373.1 peptidoglycan-binding protein [Salmonella enterica]ESE81331.1 EF hand domain-containing protein [Salmonella enterica subsp. indica serovar 6,14,25:z10:1,(2),7 str. 1121]